MAKSLGALRFLLWIGIVMFLFWFMVFCFGSAKLFALLTFNETPDFMLRVYAIFPLSWAILYFFALKDIEKNIAIVNAGIIMGILVFISCVVYSLVYKEAGVFHLISAAILFVFSLLLYFFKPELKKV